ncbi:putative ABC transporter permease [Bifidobacterium callimiconis]|uniref:Transporter n=1 Tax=Bifidobacterium callimiconis TaxID=2306973 RepID=A0A430FCT8_9BIFI|nr:transporter [Bifidobacterium callimiconis]
MSHDIVLSAGMTSMDAAVTVLYLEHLFFWAVCYSFLGWVYETILVSVQERRFVNRGFLNGPLCPIYGTGAVVAIVVLTPLKDTPMAVLTMFLLGAVGASVLEYATSWVMEKAFHARWWDYSHFKFNLNGRICLIGAIVFGVFGVLIVDVAQPWVERWTALIPLTAFHIIIAALVITIFIDFLITVIGLSGFARRLAEFTQALERSRDIIRERLGDYGLDPIEALQRYSDAAAGRLQSYTGAAAERMRDLADNLPELPSLPSLPRVHGVGRLYDTLTDALNAQQKRMLRSFPRMTSVDYGETIKQLREMLNRNDRKHDDK